MRYTRSAGVRYSPLPPTTRIVDTPRRSYSSRTRSVKGVSGSRSTKRLHQRVADHKVGCAAVLVDEQQRRAVSDRFDDVGGLRGRAGRVVGGKIAHVAVAGQPADERRDVQIPNAAAVLRGDGDGALVGQHQLAPVAGDMVIDAGGDGVQQRAFARVAARRR